MVGFQIIYEIEKPGLQNNLVPLQNNAIRKQADSHRKIRKKNIIMLCKSVILFLIILGFGGSEKIYNMIKRTTYVYVCVYMCEYAKYKNQIIKK